MLTGKEKNARFRARKRGEYVVELKPGFPKGYKQSAEHIEKAKRFGPEHHSWIGDNAKIQTGRARAERMYPEKKSCHNCGKITGLVERHHKDGNTLNNSHDNIYFECRRCHMEGDGRLEKLIANCRGVGKEKLKCFKCNHRWVPKKIKRCPKCKSYNCRRERENELTTEQLSNAIEVEEILK